MWEDTIVEEVRAARARHAEQFNFDLWLIFEDLKEQERRGKREVVTLPPRRRSLTLTGKQSLQPKKSPDAQPAGP